MTKFKLSFEVVLSAVLGYFFVAESNWSWRALILIAIGGTFLTCASIATNQIWERKLDAMMNRTQSRPLPSGRISVTEAVIAVIVFLTIGLVSMWMINFNTFWLGILSYVSYAFIYTPLKRTNSIAVFVGAFPGALPPLIGAVAAQNAFTFEGGILFFIQFVWQFPHFWAIAWYADEDYSRAGFKLLPFNSGKSKANAMMNVVYCFFLILFTCVPWLYGLTGTWSLVIGAVCAVLFFLSAVKLYFSLDDKDAKMLMFASFFYLPIVQIVLVLDKIPQTAKEQIIQLVH